LIHKPVFGYNPVKIGSSLLRNPAFSWFEQKKPAASVAPYHGMPSDFYKRIAIFRTAIPIWPCKTLHSRRGIPPQTIAGIPSIELGTQTVARSDSPSKK
jgi:hypothetical protein